MASRQEMNITDGMDTREAERGVRLCLKGSWELPRQSPDDLAWEDWCNPLAVKALAGHVLSVMALARSGDVKGIVRLDAAFSGGLIALFPEDATPAAPDALWKNLNRALADESMPGHLATLCAVNAVTFHLGAVVALQSVFFLEWSVRQKSGINAPELPTLHHFLVSCSPFVRQLPQFIRSHETAPLSRLSIR